MATSISNTETKNFYEQDPCTKSGEEVKENIMESKPPQIDKNYISINVEKSSPILFESDQKKNGHNCFHCREIKKN